MKRIWIGALALALALAGCTADFFVGPSEGSSSTSEGQGATGSGSQTSVTPGTTGGGAGTTGSPTTQDPELTTSSTTDEPTTDPETDEETGSTTANTTGEPTGETEEPADCVEKDGPACGEAFPSCLWNGEACTPNLCDIGDEKACLTEAPDCIWDGGGCVPSECGEETECDGLEPGPCEEAEGCVLAGESCFTPACVPCGEVADAIACNELPNCDYNEGREACLPQ